MFRKFLPTMALAAVAAANHANAASVIVHVTDGLFNASAVLSNDSPEWGGTTVTPFLVDGAPVLEGSAITPEPGTLWILGTGGLVLLGLWKRKQGQVA